jgi:Zn finger protein HypA/HybF involved in hydrogenase expression
MNPFVQIREPWLEFCLVVLPRHAVHSGSRLALERVVRHAKCIDCDVVQERSELLLLPLPCGLPYASQRLGHTFPALCPECALLVRVPLGPRPWLHRLRRRSPGFVRRFLSYYTGVRLLQVVHRRLRLLAFPPRTLRPEGRMAGLETSRFPCKERPCMPGSPTTPNRSGARTSAPARLAFRFTNSVGIRESPFAAQWLACTLPYRRFADILAEVCARLGADVGCYSFIVVDLHHLLLAGLPAH